MFSLLLAIRSSILTVKSLFSFYFVGFKRARLFVICFQAKWTLKVHVLQNKINTHRSPSVFSDVVIVDKQ